MINRRILGLIGTTVRSTDMDAGTLCRHSSPSPGPLGVGNTKQAEFSYSISGAVGALGGMLFSEGMKRLQGTWYDRTDKMTQFRADEVTLGLSKFADADAHEAARRTIANMKSPARVDVDIHFVTKDGVEDITVRGQRGTRSFCFDFNKAEEATKTLPEGSDVFQPFFDTIDEIVAAIKQVR